MKIFSKNGLTLTELLISTVLIGIVMLGVASVSIFTKQLQESTSQSTLINMKATAAMRYFIKDAALATGNNIDRGIYTLDDGDNINVICFRQDDNDIASYNDDLWQCYGRESSGYLWQCAAINPPFIPPFAWGDDCPLATRTFLLEITNDNFYNVVEDLDGRLDYIEIILTTRNNTSEVIHPVTNPEYSITTNISPLGHSR